MLQQFR